MEIEKICQNKNKKRSAKRFKITSSGCVKRNKANHDISWYAGLNKAKCNMRRPGVLLPADIKIIKGLTWYLVTGELCSEQIVLCLFEDIEKLSNKLKDTTERVAAHLNLQRMV